MNRNGLDSNRQMGLMSGSSPPIHRRKIVADDSYSGKFYCVKCKDHRDATGDVVVNEKGTRIAKAKCPVCGTNLTRFLPKA